MTDVFYVSPDGDDKNVGDEASPFFSLQRARDAAREVDGATTIYLRDGVYSVTETLVLGLEDANTTFVAYEGESPVLSSGIPIVGWQKLEGPIEGLPDQAQGQVWVADIPEGLGRFLTLFDGDKRLKRARSEPFLPVKEYEYERAASQNVAREEDRHMLRQIDFPDGALKNWANLEDVEVLVTPVPWTMNILPLESVDEENGVAWTAREATAPVWAKNKFGIWVENVIDFLTEPGEWVVDTQVGKVYLWPEGDKPGDEIVAPCLKEFIRVEGNIDYDGPVDVPLKNVTFRGITFTHGERDVWDEEHKGWGIQHDWEMFDRNTGLLRFRGAEDCVVEACRFTNSGGTAIRLDLHCQRIRIEKNLIDYMGALGILLCGYGPGTKDVNKDNEIVNNLLHHCGEVIWHGHAIFVWQSGSNRIANNLIHHSARKAIGLCGVRVTILENPDHTFDEAVKTIRWGEIEEAIAPDGDNFDRFMPFLHARDNVVEDNEVYRVLEKIGDGSAINVSGAAEGNILRRNYAHHIAVHTASSVMRVDDWQRGTTFVDNVIYMCNLGGITRKNLNHIENNIMADVRIEGYLRFASYPDEKEAYGSKIQRNIFYESGADVTYYKPAYLASPDVTLPQHCKADHNVFYSAGDTAFSEEHIAEMQKLGIEENSVSADPLFVDIENGDFSLHPDSPALKLGFKSIDMSAIGLRDDFPKHFLALDEPDDGAEIEWDRGRNPDKEAYAWW